MVALLASPLSSDARVVTSNCNRTISGGGSQFCTFILAGGVTGTATAQPDDDGFASVHLLITADPRDLDGNPLIEPQVLAECSATAQEAPATCSATFHPELASLPTSGANQSNGSNLPGRCTGTVNAGGSFNCTGGTV